MPLRGRGRGRAAGPTRSKTTVAWDWEHYKPDADVYNLLFRVHKAPPVVTPNLPNACPLMNAESRILERRHTEDGLNRPYYRVRIRPCSTVDHQIKHGGEGTPRPRSTSTPSWNGGDDSIGHEVIEEVDMSCILHYVSERELERFENAEFAAEARMLAVARTSAAEELKQMRLAKNARRGRGRGGRMLTGLGAQENDPIEAASVEGASKKERGLWKGRGMIGLPRAHEETILETEAEDTARRGQSLSDVIRRNGDGNELGETFDAIHPQGDSPNMARSSFIMNSALYTNLLEEVPGPSNVVETNLSVSGSDEDGTSSSTEPELMLGRGNSLPLLESADDSNQNHNRHQLFKRRRWVNT